MDSKENRNIKEQEVAYLSDALENSQMTVCVDYLGLSVSQIGDLRQQLRESGAEAKVIKNTLARLAVSTTLKDAPAEDLEKFAGLFKGPSLIIFGKEEAVAPAKVLSKFAKDNEKMQIKGAWFSGSFIDSDGVDAISKMPSREETLAKLLSLLNTPAQQLMRLLNTPARQVVQVVDAHRQNLS